MRIPKPLATLLFLLAASCVIDSPTSSTPPPKECHPPECLIAVDSCQPQPQCVDPFPPGTTP